MMILRTRRGSAGTYNPPVNSHNSKPSYAFLSLSFKRLACQSLSLSRSIEATIKATRCVQLLVPDR